MEAFRQTGLIKESGTICSVDRIRSPVGYRSIRNNGHTSSRWPRAAAPGCAKLGEWVRGRESRPSGMLGQGHAIWALGPAMVQCGLGGGTGLPVERHAVGRHHGPLAISHCNPLPMRLGRWAALIGTLRWPGHESKANPQSRAEWVWATKHATARSGEARGPVLGPVGVVQLGLVVAEVRGRPVVEGGEGDPRGLRRAVLPGPTAPPIVGGATEQGVKPPVR